MGPFAQGIHFCFHTPLTCKHEAWVGLFLRDSPWSVKAFPSPVWDRLMETPLLISFTVLKNYNDGSVSKSQFCIREKVRPLRGHWPPWIQSVAVTSPVLLIHWSFQSSLSLINQAINQYIYLVVSQCLCVQSVLFLCVKKAIPAKVR